MSFYTLKRQGVFYFRIRVPQDLQHYFPYPEIKRSLHTKNSQHAKQQVRLWSSKTEHVFMSLRANIIAHEQVQAFIHRELPSVWRKTIGDSSPSSTCKQNQDSQRKAKQLEQVMEDYLREHVTLGKWTEKTTSVNRH